MKQLSYIIILSLVFLVECFGSDLQTYFQKYHYDYPIHIIAEENIIPTVGGVESGSYPSDEIKDLYDSGLEFIKTNATLKYLKDISINSAEGFLLKNPFIYKEVEPYGYYFAVSIIVYGEGPPPFKAEKIDDTDFWRLSNIALFKKDEKGFVFSGHIY